MEPSSYLRLAVVVVIGFWVVLVGCAGGPAGGVIGVFGHPKKRAEQHLVAVDDAAQYRHRLVTLSPGVAQTLGKGLARGAQR